MKGQGFFHQAIRQTGVGPDGLTLHQETSGGVLEQTKSVGKCRGTVGPTCFQKGERTGKADVY